MTGYLAESQYRMVAAGSPLIAGALPLSTEAAVGLQARKRLALGTGVAGLILCSVGLVLQLTYAFLAGLVILMAAVLLVRRLSKVLTARIVSEQVVLSGVHPDFVVAITRPAKCADCPGKATCDITEMLACDEHGDVVGSAHS